MDYELLSAAQRDAIVAVHLRQHLPPLGLIENGPRKWIDGRQPPVRRLFELRLVKGAGLKVCWGFSLDFVPHISGGRVRWHRSDKTAMLDVIVDPRSLAPATYIHGAERLAADLRSVLPEAVSRAKETWDKGTTYQGMLDIIREIRELRSNALGYDNYAQMPLAYVFLSAKIGDVQSAEQELDRCGTARGLSEAETAKLKKLARQYAGDPHGLGR